VRWRHAVHLRQQPDLAANGDGTGIALLRAMPRFMPARSREQLSWSMLVAAHHAHVPRRRRREMRDHMLVLTLDRAVRRWVEHETFGERMTIEFVDQLADALSNLASKPPQLLIVDADAISRAEVELLAEIRDAGWRGKLIAIGDVNPRSLGVDLALERKFDCELLRNALKRLASERPNVFMRRIGR
jgi:hypothetical protein